MRRVDHMSKIRCLNVVFLALALAAVMVISVSGQAAAGAKPSPSTCSDKGLITVNCIVCATGEKIGVVSVQAEYDPQYGDCMKRYGEVKGKCARAYNRSQSDLGGSWSYYIGTTRYYGHYPKACKAE